MYYNHKKIYFLYTNAFILVCFNLISFYLKLLLSLTCHKVLNGCGNHGQLCNVQEQFEFRHLWILSNKM